VIGFLAAWPFGIWKRFLFGRGFFYRQQRLSETGVWLTGCSENPLLPGGPSDRQPQTGKELHKRAIESRTVGKAIGADGYLFRNSH